MKVNNPFDKIFPYKAYNKKDLYFILDVLRRNSYTPHPNLKSINQEDELYPITVSCLDKRNKYYIIY